MLRISRYENEQGIVVITPQGEKLTFFISKVFRYRAEISFENFEGFQVYREELWEKIQADKEKDNENP